MPDDHLAISATGLPAEYTSISNIGLAIWFNDALFDRAKMMAKYLSEAHGFVPPHLAGKPQACFAVVVRSLTWKMDPYAVAMCTYETPGGKVGFEGKLCQAILENSGKLDGGVTYEHFGDWGRVKGKFEKKTSQKGKEYMVPTWTRKDAEGLGVIVRAQVKGEAAPREWTVDLDECFPLNSTLWATKPNQQICYTAARAFANIACPGIFLGTPFDSEGESGGALIDVTPMRPSRSDFDVPSANAAAPAVPDAEEEEDESSDSISFAFVDVDGVEHAIADPAEWGNRFYAALKEAPNPQMADGIWEANSPQLIRFRAAVDGGAKLADTIENAYGDAIKQRAAAATEDKPDAPRKLGGKMPRKDDGGFDWAKRADELSLAIETSKIIDDVKEWQAVNMDLIQNISTNDSHAYGIFQQRVAAVNSRLIEGA